MTYFTIYFSQYINFHKISYRISLWILAVSKDNPILQNMHTYKFTKYTFYVSIYRSFSDFTYLKIIKDYS